MIHLEEVSPDNWRLDLHVRNDQKDFAANSITLLARAYAYREYRSRAFFILNDKTYVGMGLFYDCPERDAYIFSQLFIDEKFQGQGFGKTAAKIVLEEMKKDGKYKKSRSLLCRRRDRGEKTVRRSRIFGNGTR